MEETFRRSYNRILIIFGRWSIGGGGDKRVIKVHVREFTKLGYISIDPSNEPS